MQLKCIEQAGSCVWKFFADNRGSRWNRSSQDGSGNLAGCVLSSRGWTAKDVVQFVRSLPVGHKRHPFRRSVGHGRLPGATLRDPDLDRWRRSGGAAPAEGVRRATHRTHVGVGRHGGRAVPLLVPVAGSSNAGSDAAGGGAQGGGGPAAAVSGGHQPVLLHCRRARGEQCRRDRQRDIGEGTSAVPGRVVRVAGGAGHQLLRASDAIPRAVRQHRLPGIRRVHVVRQTRFRHSR